MEQPNQPAASGGPREQPWPEDFPAIRTHADWQTLKATPEYKEAKAGDPEAAVRVVDRIIRPNLVRDLANLHPDAIVVAPHAEEASGRNALPVAYTNTLAHAGGFQLEDQIVQVNRPHRTGKSAVHRLVNRPEFTGPVQAGRDYILVDDVAAQGGTLSELRKYIEGKGGKVVAVTAPAHAAPESTRLALDPGTAAELTNKFGKDSLNKFLNDYRIANSASELTESEAQYLLGWESLDALGDHIASEGL